MAEIIRLRSSPHDEVQQLLPWLANGTLAPEEILRVDAHLAECAECRADAAAEQSLAHAVAGLPLDCGNSWQRISKRLQLDVPAEAPTDPALWRRRVPLGWAIASPFAAAAAVALVFVNVATMRQPSPEPLYHALGAVQAPEPANLVVQFAPATRIADMQSALQGVDARLVDGPTETGAYLLRVDQRNRELALKRLRDNQAIALAEPIDAAATQ
jgi:anti-sigma factor RsiW